MPSNKIRVLRISHSSVVPEYRERDRALLRNYPVEIELVTPYHWPHIGLANGAEIEESFPVTKAHTIGSGSVPLFAFDPFAIGSTIQKFNPQVIDIHEEPYSVSGFECVLLANIFAPKSASIFYSAQNILKQYPPPFVWSERFVYDSCKAAYPCSKGVADVLSAKGFSKPTFIIPLGIDPNIFAKANQMHSIGEAVRIGCAGRLTRSKGFDVLISALAKLPPDTQWELRVAGSGPESGPLQKQCDLLGLEERINWLGELSASDMPSFYKSCDIFVVPSKTTKNWKEQFGRVAVEAMAASCCVIASDSGSLPEVIGDAGIVVAEDDSEALYTALSKVITDHQFRQSLAEAARLRAISLYSWDKVAELMYAMYCSVVDPAGSLCG